MQLSAAQGGAALGPVIILSASAIAVLIGLGSVVYGWSSLGGRRR